MAHGPPEPPPADQAAEPSEVDVVDATAEAFRAAVAEGDLDRADRIAAALPRRELRDALRGLTPEQTEALYARLGDERLAELLDPLEPEDAGDVLLRLTDAGAADVLDELEPDDAADVIAAIKAEEPERAQPILVEMDRAGDVQELLSFLPDTAGGRMTTEFVAVPPLATAEEAMRVLRAHARDGEVRSYVYATDPAGVLVGVVPLHRLVLVDLATTVADLMVRDPVRVRGTDDQEDVARVFRERRFLAVPVVDLEERLIGIVTADDVADVMEEEATEDIAKLGGGDGRVGPAAGAAAAAARPGGRLRAVHHHDRRRHGPDHLLRDRPLPAAALRDAAAARPVGSPAGAARARPTSSGRPR